MRTTHTCPKCRHRRLLSIAAVADDGSLGGLLIAKVPHGRGSFRGAGNASAMVCKGCGYAEIYVFEPESIPVDGQYVVEVEGEEDHGPYR